MFFKFVVPLCGAAAITALSAAAQPPALPGPADARAPVPPVKYESAFAGYMPYREPEVQSWQAVNEAARSAGGHKGMAGMSGPDTRAGQGEADKAQEPKAESPARSPASPHGAHR